jgi:cytochrome P450
MTDTRTTDGEARASAAGCPIVHLDASRCDLMADFAGLFPTRVFLEVIDLSSEQAPMFMGWADTIFNGLAFGGGPLTVRSLPLRWSV